MNANATVSFDSIYNEYRCGLTFQFSLQAEKSSMLYGNLKYYDIHSPEDLAIRTRLLSFSADEMFAVNCNSNAYLPAMIVFDGFNEIENKITFTMVFQIEEYGCGAMSPTFSNIIFTFDDLVWGLGKNHLQFDKSVFENKPKLDI
jgi:hypothetical protein